MIYGDVLIIDSDTNYHQDYKRYLKNIPAIRNIVFAPDGIQGMFKLNNQVFMAVIVSREVEKKSWVEIVKNVKEIEKIGLARLVLVSNRCEKEELDLVQKIGIKNFLLKPFIEDFFIEKMRKVLA